MAASDDERIVGPAASDAEVRARHDSNRAAWNEAAGHYRDTLGEAISALKAKKSSLHPLERANLRDLASWCRRAIHLQCASGKDTLSLRLEGAHEVVGVDISDLHIENARKLSATSEIPGTFHRCDVLEAPASLDGTADLVYTGRGAICWIQDVRLWAKVVARLLRPGGVLHLMDDHPLLALFTHRDGKLILRDDVSYHDSALASKGWPANYIPELSGDASGQSWKYERAWSLSEIVQAVVEAGLAVERLGEHADPYWEVFPGVPKERTAKLPMVFTLMARKPPRQS